MYDIGRNVWVLSMQEEGRVTSRRWFSFQGKRRAVYSVVLNRPVGQPAELPLMASHELRPVDYYCDGCGKPRRGAPHRSHPDAGAFCFLCTAIQIHGRYHYA